MSYNIQGLKSKLSNVDFVHFCDVHDILSFSEINNVTYDEIRKVFVNYEVFISYRISCGGGGVAVLVRKDLLPFVTRVQSDIEECVLLHFSDKVFKRPLLAVFPYIAHESSVFYQNKILNGIENLELTFSSLNCINENVHVLIFGDLNSRVGQLNETLMNNSINEYVHGLDDCDMVTDNEDIPTRRSRDTEQNNYGRQLIQFCKINNLFILNGRTISDPLGSYTCIANGGKSVVDYCIVGRSLYDYVVDLKVMPRPESDHFALFLTLKCDFVYTEPTKNIEPINCNSIKMLKWNEKYKNVFNDILNEQFELHLEDLLSLINVDINHAIDKFEYQIFF